MTEPSIEQIRIFRLRSHHLDSVYSKSETDRLAGVRYAEHAARSMGNRTL